MCGKVGILKGQENSTGKVGSAGCNLGRGIISALQCHESHRDKAARMPSGRTESMDNYGKSRSIGENTWCPKTLITIYGTNGKLSSCPPLLWYRGCR